MERIGAENQKLLLRREEHLKQQASILESVKCLLVTNEIEKAKEQAEQLRITRYWKDVIEAFRSHSARHCGTCGSALEVVINPITLSVAIYCPDCYEKEEREKELIEIETFKSSISERIEVYLRKRGVPKRFLKARISDFPTSWQKLRESIEGIFLTGCRGVGKTHLAAALMREMILQPRPVNQSRPYKVDIQRMPLFISVPELLLEIRDTFQSDGISEKAVIDKYSMVDLLILDDLGVEKASDWVLQTLYTIMDRRYREELRTVITSNLGIEEIQEKLDDRIASRIVGMCRVCILKGKDRRVQT